MRGKISTGGITPISCSDLQHGKAEEMFCDVKLHLYTVFGSVYRGGSKRKQEGDEPSAPSNSRTTQRKSRA